jgi:glycosyltransferase involved in cell wall biosynthesis
MKPFISIIIPNYNGSRTIGACLEAVFACTDDDREVIVVDDCSEDGSLDIIRKYPCRLVQLEKHAGASGARNAGAFNSNGEVLFFIDADCLLKNDTFPVIRKSLSTLSAGMVIGGTYTPIPHDPGFFSRFQSVFINYFETKNSEAPDYVATHALAIHAETFRKAGGFQEDFLPILEDVEFSHRLRSAGYVLLMNPDLQVRHIFNFTLLKSLRNAARKAHFWIVYSLTTRDLFADSGTASREIKINGVIWAGAVLLALLSFLSGRPGLLMVLPVLWSVNSIVNRHLVRAFYTAGGAFFSFLATLYYTMVYPAAVWTGAIIGIIRYCVLKVRQLRRDRADQRSCGTGG